MAVKPTNLRPGTIRGFAPIARTTARILVLGSMPSVASLRAGEYYAHPHNRFWPIMGEILGFDASAPYAKRRAALMNAGIALWDVIGSCEREGSLDSAIAAHSIVANDFTAFLARHRRIGRVCFNGRRAEAAWRRHVLPQWAVPPALDYRLLPSTSPAHAGMGYRSKLRIWRSAIGP
ncbi:MAG: DNA-deoxyinosine glycosylase [Steroidobacteraceae bacterium]|nr:DNA-deoxyinosine glycosylase [Steroidobacteraceae bacterium]